MTGVNEERQYQEAKLIMLLRQLVEPLNTGLDWNDGWEREILNQPGYANLFAGWRCRYCMTLVEEELDANLKQFEHKVECPIAEARRELNWLDMWDK